MINVQVYYVKNINNKCCNFKGSTLNYKSAAITKVQVVNL